MSEVNSDHTDCTSTQETEFDGVGVVRSNDIAREHSKVSLPVRRNLNSVAIGQQRRSKGPNSWKSSRVADTATMCAWLKVDTWRGCVMG